MEILGVRVDNLSFEEVVGKTEDFLSDGKQHYFVTVNPEIIVSAQKDKRFREILNRADLAVADGVGLVFISRFLGASLKQRIAGVDLMERICQLAEFKQRTVFLLGAQTGVACQAAANLRKKYSGLKIGAAEKNFDNNAEILFVAFGAPKQEKWISENLKKFPSVKLAMGVGGAFDFISGRISRAPVFLRKMGLEWLWRLVVQPRRIKRIFKAVVVFPWLVVKNEIASSLHSSQ
jgi:N-acetylglucosaminyldiphosphoundecaprenol N-acetyl-beta-D-mannosaminyltransferase